MSGEIQWPGTPVNAAPAQQWPGTPVPQREAEGPADNPQFRREYELQRQTGGGVSGQVAKGIPVVGPLAQKGAAWVNSKIAGVPYETELGAMRAADAAFEREHPVAAPAIQLASGLRTFGGGPRPVLGAKSTIIPPSGPAVSGPRGFTMAYTPPVGATFTGTGGTSIGGRIASGAGFNAAVGGADAASRDGNAGTGAAIGGAVGAAGPVVGRAVGGARNWWSGARAASAAPTEQALRTAANGDFAAARQTQLAIDPRDLAHLSVGIEHGPLQDFTALQAPETFDILRRLQANPGGAAMAGPNELLTIREQLLHAAQSQDAREALAASRAMEHFDNFLSSQPSQFSDLYARGRGNWGAASRSGRFSQDVLENASRNADVAHAGENLGNNTRQRLNAVIKSNQRGSELGRGLNEDEIAEMDRVARGTGFANTMRRTQSLTGGLKRGSIASGIGAYVGSHFGPWGIPIGAAVPHVISDLARRAAEASTVRGAQGIDDMLRMRSPLAQATAAPARAQAAATSNRAMTNGQIGARLLTPIAQSLYNMLRGGNERR